tara:strand:- start:29 stop:487 length:459 start_codon:yes stop_codon:yes gene_type:complete
MINENLKLSGQLNIVLTDKAGIVKEQREVKNLVVNAGLAYIISRMLNTSKSVMSHMALGSGTTAAAASQTDLGTTLGSREALTSSTITGSNSEKVVYVATFDAGDATGAVSEAGVFNATTSGDMLCRTVFSVVNKQADDTLSVTWTITLAAS